MFRILIVLSALLLTATAMADLPPVLPVIDAPLPVIETVTVDVVAAVTPSCPGGVCPVPTIPKGIGGIVTQPACPSGSCSIPQSTNTVRYYQPTYQGNCRSGVCRPGPIRRLFFRRN